MGNKQMSEEQTTSLSGADEMQRAVEAHRAGRLQKAKDLYLEVLRSQPSHGDANHNLGVVHLELGNAKAALPYLNSAWQVSPEQGQYWLSYIDALIRVGETSAAKDLLEQGRERGLQGQEFDRLSQQLEQLKAVVAGKVKAKENVRRPEAASQAEVQALVKIFLNGENERAQQMAQVMTKSYPQLAVGWMVLGAALKQQGKSAQALAPMKEAVRLNPKDFNAHSNLGIINKDLGQLDRAQESCQRAVELNPEFAEGFNNLGSVFTEMGKLKEAEAAYRKSIQINPKLAEAYLNLGQCLTECGDFLNAINMCRESIILNKNLIEAHHIIGICFHRLKDYKNAQIELELAKKYSPTKEVIHINLGHTYNKLGLTVNALNEFEIALHVNSNSITANICIGKYYENSGNFEKSLILYKKALKIDADNIQANIGIANIYYKKKMFQESEELYAKIIIKDSLNGEAYNNLGILYRELHKKDKAIAAYKKAIFVNPELSEAYNNLASLLYEYGEYVDAEEYYYLAILKDVNLTTAYINLIKTLDKNGKFEEIIDIFPKVLDIIPESSDAYLQLADAQSILSRQIGFYSGLTKNKKLNKLTKNIFLNNAVKNYRISLEMHNNNAVAYYSLGNALRELGELDAAEKASRRAIDLSPDLAEAYSNVGATLDDMGKIEDAVNYYRKAIELKPELLVAHSNLGNALNQLGLLADAEEACLSALRIYPDFAEAYGILGNILKGMNNYTKAEEYYRKAISIKPSYAPPYSNLSTLLKLTSRFVEALKYSKNAIELDVTLTSAQQTYSSMLAHLSDFGNVVEHSNFAISGQYTNQTIWESRLFAWIYHPDLSAQEICDEHVRWGKLQPEVVAPSFVSRDKTPQRRLRVGYFSPDFRQHTCRFYFDPLFANHDHLQVELFAYSNVSVEDDHTLRMKGYFDHWRSIRGVSDVQASELIQQDGIDILVDACGHMAGTRLGVFVHRPAPIQVTWLGAAWTTGLKQMDYAVFDPHMAPEGTCTSEEIVRLPRTWAAFRPGDKAMNTEVAELPALRTGQITFGYSGRTERLNYKVFSVWAKILQRLPSARLILDYRAFGDPLTREYYREFLARHGVDVTRVVMRSSDNIFEALGEVDILLDSFPHSGGTMLFDALWMGVPALTLAARPPVGRIGTSLMTNLGLPEWVAKDEQEYEDKAVAFAQDIAALASLRSGMRSRMQASPVMDEKGFARDMERAYETMWRTWVDSSNQELSSVRNN